MDNLRGNVQLWILAAITRRVDTVRLPGKSPVLRTASSDNADRKLSFCSTVPVATVSVFLARPAEIPPFLKYIPDKEIPVPEFCVKLLLDGFRSAVAADKSLVQQYSNVLRQLRLSVDISP